MKKFIITMAFLINLLSNAQTIEKTYSDFELIANVKWVKEYSISGISSDTSIDFENIEKLVSNPTTKTRVTNEYNFNSDGFIIELKEYFTNPKVFHQEVYSYDKSNLLLEVTEKESPIDTVKHIDYSKIKFTRNGNEVVKTSTYVKEDSMYNEKLILKNNYIIEEKAPNSETLRAKYEYDKNRNKLNGTIILESREKIKVDKYFYILSKRNY